MLRHPIIVINIFEVWGIDVMGLFLSSFWNTYILMCVDYMFKWIETIPMGRNEAMVVVRL